ncbi:MAG TPA: long-chain fatty acid--CoA ligase, partial [Rhodanobacter sp.]|nr:long-chain fatty acid--CoA ligase [Rhodanobacter sp.]
MLTGLPGRIGDTIGTWAERTPERPAILEHDGSWTYGELARAVATARRWLSERDVRPGDRVMVVSENCRTVVAVFLAISELDAWPVLVNARLSEREIDEIRAHCTPRRVIYAVGASVYARAHAERHGASRETVAELGPVGIGPGDDTALPEKVETDGSKQVGALIYTSGSTGRPKGVMLTHRNLLFIAALAGRVRSVTPADRLYAVMPISHSVGLSSVLLCTLLSGASVYLAPRFNPADVIATLRQDGVTILLGTPVLFALLTEYANSKGIAAVSSPTLRIISASGSPLDAVVKAAAERLFALPLHHGYGITECSPTIAQTRPGQPRVDLSVGPLLPGVEAKLVQPDGATAPDGEAGELFVRGPNLMKGYYRAPKETADAIDRDGWFRTGDLARIDDGNLFLIGRAKELIIRFG